MKSNLKGALKNLDKCWMWFEHKGQPMTKDQVKRMLMYGIAMGYKDTGQLSDEEVNKIMSVEINR